MENLNKNFKFIKTITDLNIILVESIKVLKQVSEQVDDYAEVSALLQHSRNKCFRLLDEQLVVEFWNEGVRDCIIRFHNYVQEFAESAERMITHNKNIFSLMDKLALEEDESTIQETFKDIKS